MAIEFVSSPQAYLVRTRTKRKLLRKSCRHTAILSLAIFQAACSDSCQTGGRPSQNPAVAPPTYDADFDFTLGEGLDASVVLPACQAVRSEGAVSSTDAGAATSAVIDQRAFAQSLGGTRAVGWIDREAHQLRVQFAQNMISATDTIPNVYDSLVMLSLSGARDAGTEQGRWLIHLQVSENNQRFRRIFQSDGVTVARVFQAPVQTDSDDNVSAINVPGGVLFFWTSTGPDRMRIVSSRWSESSPAILGAPGVVSDLAHNACEPVLTQLSATAEAPDGALLLAYLNNHDDPLSNRSTADIVLRRITLMGQPNGPAVILTPSAKPRFSVTLANRGASTWVAWRLGRDSESEGPVDGGIVAAVTLRADLRALGEPEYISDPDVTPVGAMRLLPSQSGMDLYWIERSADEMVTLHRAVSVEGRGVGPARQEPVFAGELPVGGTAARPIWLQATDRSLQIRSAECGAESQ